MGYRDLSEPSINSSMMIVLLEALIVVHRHFSANKPGEWTRTIPQLFFASQFFVENEFFKNTKGLSFLFEFISKIDPPDLCALHSCTWRIFSNSPQSDEDWMEALNCHEVTQIRWDLPESKWRTIASIQGKMTYETCGNPGESYLWREPITETVTDEWGIPHKEVYTPNIIDFAGDAFGYDDIMDMTLWHHDGKKELPYFAHPHDKVYLLCRRALILCGSDFLRIVAGDHKHINSCLDYFLWFQTKYCIPENRAIIESNFGLKFRELSAEERESCPNAIAMISIHPSAQSGVTFAEGHEDASVENFRLCLVPTLSRST